MKLISSWSGGKDSCFALMQALKLGHELTLAFNVMNEHNNISRSHGISRFVLEQQATVLGTTLVTIASSWSSYEEKYIQKLKELKSTYEVDAVVFGDIDIEQHRLWEEKVCSRAHLQALLPLWQQSRKELAYAMIDAGIKAIITSCNQDLGQDYLGREITRALIEELEVMGIDACGENGEYHTLVIDCPLFDKPLKLPSAQKMRHKNYNFLVWDH